MSTPNAGFRLICPECGDPLARAGPDKLSCARDDLVWNAEDGIWRMLSATQRREFDPRVRQYLEIRRSEGWGDDDPKYYRALPFVDRSGRFPEVWRLRAQSFRHLQRRILRPMAGASGGSLRIIDAGAGNGWLSCRLARAGHQLVAVDICTDRLDGLGALCLNATESSVLALQASFDRIPIAPGQADLLIFNGSLHYSSDYLATLRQATPLLATDGRIVVMDTPYYRREEDGRKMLEERRAGWQDGDRQDLTAMQGFLTPETVDRLCSELGIDARTLRPPAAWRAAAAAVKSHLLGRRARAAFPLIEFRPARSSL